MFTVPPAALTVTFCVGTVALTKTLPKLRLDVESVAVPAPAPTPTNGIVAGESGALSFIVIVPFIVPAAVGLNVTLIVQLPPTINPPQLFVCVKSPLAVIDVILTATLNWFFTVTDCDGLATPIA